MENNPLKQYFRRPAVYLKLPSGGLGYPENVIDMPVAGELPVYPMTAIDDITSRTPDALFNGTAVVELIRSCVPNIKDPWEVTNSDLDAILIAIKTASSPSGEMDIESICPACETQSTYSINLSSVLSSIESSDYTKELVLGDLKIRMKPISFKEVNNANMEQFEFQRIAAQIDLIEDDDQKNKLIKESLEKITSLTMNLLSHGIESIETPTTQVTEREFILDFLRNCDRNAYIAIRDYSGELRAKSEVKPMKVTCASCNHQFEQNITLNPTDFFD